MFTKTISLGAEPIQNELGLIYTWSISRYNHFGEKSFFVLARWEKTDAQSKRADRGCITAGRSRLLPALTKSAIHIIERKRYYAAQRTVALI